MTGNIEERCVEWKNPGGVLKKEWLNCYEIKLFPLDQTFYLYGDLCAIRAKVLRIHPFFQKLGFKNPVRLDMIYNGYKNASDYQCLPVEAVALVEKKSWKTIFLKVWEPLFFDQDRSSWVKSSTLESNYFPLTNSLCEPYIGTFYLTINSGGLSSLPVQ